MAASLQPDHDCYKAIVLRKHGTELLVIPTPSGFVLPSAEIPRWQRVAANLTTALKRQWGCEAVCLFSREIGDRSEGARPRFRQVMECWQNSERPTAPATWTLVLPLGPHSFADSKDYVALHQSLDQVQNSAADDSHPFLKLGWFNDLQTWVRATSQALGIELTGKFTQFNASPSFSLIRFETTGTALWFKAVGEPNQHEFAITLTLAERFPRYLPTIIASHPAWHGWLMKDGGTAMAESISTLGQWQDIAAELAGLQLESMGHSELLLAAGAKDLRIDRLLNLVEPFLHAMNILMRRQQKASPPTLTSKELFDLGLGLQEALEALNRNALPVTLGHSDFNPGNILRSATGSVFVDWAQAHVGHPFVTFEYLLSYLRRDRPEIAAFEDFLRTAYTQPWKHAVPVQSIVEAAIFAPIVAIFACAVRLSFIDADYQDERSVGYLRSLTRRMKREVDQLEARRMTCRRS